MNRITYSLEIQVENTTSGDLQPYPFLRMQ